MSGTEPKYFDKGVSTMIIKHNMSAINAHRVLKFNHWKVDDSIRKLSSGLRINRAGDDASGLAVSEKMRAQILGLRQAERNAEDSMSFIQTADGYLDQLTNIFHRMRVLSIQAANGIYASEERQLMQVEVSQLIDEVDRVASQAEFNQFKLFQGDFSRNSRTASIWFHIGANQHQRERAYIGTMTASSLNLMRNGRIATLSTVMGANNLIGIIDESLNKILKQRSDLGAYYNRLENVAKGLMSAYENIQASESRIRDVDMAEEIAVFTTSQILAQSGMAMLAHANLKVNSIINLLS